MLMLLPHQDIPMALLALHVELRCEMHQHYIKPPHGVYCT